MGQKWCVHYSGMFEKPPNPLVKKETCDAGVSFDSVKNATGSGLGRFPCFGEGADLPCAKRRWPSAEEIAEERAFIQKRVDEIKQRLAGSLCIECGEPCTVRVVGRCGYAEPCGHRQGQWRAEGE